MVRIDQSINGKLGTGAPLAMTVAANVTASGATVIRAGTPVVGMLTEAQGPGYLGREGKLTLQIQSTTSVDGQLVSLSGVRSAEGDDRVIEAVVIGLVLCICGLCIKGKDATVPAGTTLLANTVTELTVVVSD